MDVKQILKDADFKFNKQFGQNFLTDKELLSDIVKDADIRGGTVLEIGAGAGTLTRELAVNADSVIAFEIDRNLEKVLQVTLSEFDNVKVVIGDIMRYKISEIESLCGGVFTVVANIPYYLTTPLIMMFVEQSDKVQSMTLTIQKEVAERLCASPSTKDYGAITVAVNAVADVTLMRVLPRELFYPQPNVDSAVVRIDMNRTKFDIENRALFRKTVKSAFAMRRKTLVNNLTVGFGISRSAAEKLLADCGLSTNCRGEELSAEKFVELYKRIEKENLL
ncbi:MAG: 16S rRNA (adenine(1518)-N(6)/adenine(1519)-N(6))-dimethyltransferase RsmA [Corallococcus sp.]|nr:16S rRNA (adenine(1518)-N(6)/adenine(1519)-N(6))-dimethyltransferase RsmA [Bacillota bacterium]MCM1533055.1 16S rRNA (adenine(1518)-N(6)/adenine(1519)-N(6))-dimethyltransferase RsmA [Corallococcus sp.]